MKTESPVSAAPQLVRSKTANHISFIRFTSCLRRTRWVVRCWKDEPELLHEGHRSGQLELATFAVKLYEALRPYIDKRLIHEPVDMYVLRHNERDLIHTVSVEIVIAR